MKLIAGLGNPGQSYKYNRHNIGFMALDQLAADQNLIFKKKKYYDFVKSGDYLLIKPRTFMNRSGLAISSAFSSFNITDLLVIYDDVNLSFAEFRLRHKGGSGGHNGIKSIISHLGREDFKRIRIGAGAPQANQDMADYVLADFSTQERKFLPQTLQYCTELLKIFIKEDFNALLDFHSITKKTYSEKLIAFQDH